MRPETTLTTPARPETARERRVRRLSAFRPEPRRLIAGLTCCAPALEDLADSFPALLFALATGYGTAQGREAACRVIQDGQPLKHAAAAIGLPLWLRRLPADACLEPMPALPIDEAFAIQMANAMPRVHLLCATWFDRMLAGYRLGGRELALWIARDGRLLPPHTSEESFHWLLAWAWTGLTPGTPGHALVRSPWTPAMTGRRALDETALWRKRTELVPALSDPTRDPWFADGVCGVFSIVQLRSVGDFITESQAMENCLDQYAAHLAYGRVRIFSVRRAGRSVADVELTLRADNTSETNITQVRGPGNRRASPAVWQAVHGWLGAQPERRRDGSPTPVGLARIARDGLWRPYVETLTRLGLPRRLLLHVYTPGLTRPANRNTPPQPTEQNEAHGTAARARLLGVLRRLARQPDAGAQDR